MRNPIFNTKFTSDYDRNGQAVEILKKCGDKYLVRFPDGYEVKVYPAEIDFGY